MATKKKVEVEVATKEEAIAVEETPVVEEAKSIDEFLDEGAPLVEEPTPKKKKEKVEVDVTPVDKSNAVEAEVRIKMKENHRCCIAGEFFVLQKGQCYNVPKEVKMRLSKAGLLLPL